MAADPDSEQDKPGREHRLKGSSPDERNDNQNPARNVPFAASGRPMRKSRSGKATTASEGIVRKETSRPSLQSLRGPPSVSFLSCRSCSSGRPWLSTLRALSWRNKRSSDRRLHQQAWDSNSSRKDRWSSSSVSSLSQTVAKDPSSSCKMG
jgi:hypothetical protein